MRHAGSLRSVLRTVHCGKHLSSGEALAIIVAPNAARQRERLVRRASRRAAARWHALAL